MPHMLRNITTTIIFHLADGKTEANADTNLAQSDRKSEQGLALDLF